ncbi:hypothetical protein ARMSODRAFT_515578 [Armillaria solidipes]|uniref:Myosin motor domain-containing protein n=1 Tax=Armillaria solidipes TaxID=1076256 RepID=A0A2H3BLS9_9AGAR|nr:hypothetical protein ARMSODRAFT_515578 [Armillaria solidipes]
MAAGGNACALYMLREITVLRTDSFHGSRRTPEPVKIRPRQGYRGSHIFERSSLLVRYTIFTCGIVLEQYMRAWANMGEEREDQSILITGKSGADKTRVR